jgi:hypothetical protein
MRDHGRVVPEEFHTLFGHWCAARVPEERRDELQVGYTIQGDEVTIVRRHAPAYPELGAAWSSARVAQLRYGEPEPGMWTLYGPHEDDWRRYDAVPAADRPEPLLDEVERDPSGLFWG